MKIKNICSMAALCFAAISFGCGVATNTTNSTINKLANTTNAANTSATSANTTGAANTLGTANTGTAKVETGDSNTGVAECDDFIEKYDACLVTVQSKYPQYAAGIKESIESAHIALKDMAKTQSKASLPTTCKQMAASAKASTGQWCTNW
jgi:hypothetical protein